MISCIFWIISAFVWTFLMSFFSTQEMACISYNRLKLEAASKKGIQSALRIKSMVENPLLLFGTTLFGVNICLVVSSESMRQAFDSVGLNPNLSALVHIPYVLIFGELVPMFAARLFPEHMARLGIPLLWATSILFRPIITFSSRLFSSFQETFLGKAVTTSKSASIQLDELHEILNEAAHNYHVAHNNEPELEDHSAKNHIETSSEIQLDRAQNSYLIESISGRVLSMRDKLVRHCMVHCDETIAIHMLKHIQIAAKAVHHFFLKETKEDSKTHHQKIESQITPSQRMLATHILIKEKNGKVIGLVSTKTLFLHAVSMSTKGAQPHISNSSPQFLFQLALPICYIGEETSLSEAFVRMKKEEVEAALIISQEGEIIGYISLETILDEIIPVSHEVPSKLSLHIERTVNGDEDIIDFAQQYGLSPIIFGNFIFERSSENATFTQFIEEQLGRKPNVGDKVSVGPFLLTVKETTLLGAKNILVTTL